MRMGFLGSDRWSVPALRALMASAHDVALVVTRAPRPAGRGSKLTPTAVADAARALGLPVAEVKTVRGGPGLQALRDAKPELLVVVAYGEILPAEVLGLAPRGAVNVHFSLLPRLRGASPVQGVLLAGDETTGVTTMRIDEGLDTGPILLQAEEPVRDDDDAGTLGARLAQIGAGLLVETIDRLAAGDLEPRPQPAQGATYAPKLGSDDRWLRWDEPAESVVRRVRAFAPEPGASARFRGQVLKVLRAEAAPGSGTAGTVLAASREGFVVAAGDGAVRLLSVAPAGRRRMSDEEFVRGYRPEPGELVA